MSTKAPDKTECPPDRKPRPFDVFISYSLEDGDLAKSIHDRLASRGLTCWFDREKIDQGQSMVSTLREAIDRSKLCLLVLSKDSEAKPWVSKEWSLIQEIAWEREDLTLVPLLLGSVEPPPFLNRWQSLRCDRRKASVDRVCSKIAERLKSADQPTFLQLISAHDLGKADQRFQEILRTLKALGGEPDGKKNSDE